MDKLIHCVQKYQHLSGNIQLSDYKNSEVTLLLREDNQYT